LAIDTPVSQQVGIKSARTEHEPGEILFSYRQRIDIPFQFYHPAFKFRGKPLGQALIKRMCGKQEYSGRRHTGNHCGEAPVHPMQ
jgi:hypothetical protein